MGENTTSPQSHMVSIDNRKRIVITGIHEVTSYDSNTIVASSSVGNLIVQGKQLHINNFDQSSGKLLVDGSFDAVQYVDVQERSSGSFFSRLLK